MERIFAFVVEGDVFHVFNLGADSHPVKDRWAAALASNPIFVEAQEYSPVSPGYLYKDGNFYEPGDDNFTTPMSKEPHKILQGNGGLRYAAVVDNEVAGILTMPKDDFPPVKYEMYKAGFASSPICVQTTDRAVEEGWTWDGKEFHKPKTE
jgi:hypothetical protein